MRFRSTLLVVLLGIGLPFTASAVRPADAQRVGAFAVNYPQVVQERRGNPVGAIPGEFTMRLNGWGQRFDLQLSENEELLENLPRNRRTAINARGDAFWSGTIPGKPGSWVRMNRINGQYSGIFHDGQELYLLDAPDGFSLPQNQSVERSASLLMRLSDLDIDWMIDHGGIPVDPLRPTPGRKPRRDADEFLSHLSSSIDAATVPTSMPVTIVGDTEFFDDLGDSAESTVIARVNMVDGLYSNQLGVGIVLWHYEQLTNNGPLTTTNAQNLLTQQFRSYMRDGAGSSLPFAGLAHLFSGKNFDGSTAGVAYLNVLCSRSAGYGVNENLRSSTTSALVFAHELGHNFSASHSDSGIMRPSIGSSQDFSADSLAAMSNAVGRASCLVDNFAIFSDGFE
ncbi:MAG: M12 family metallo-peptidase [Pseudomonadota bacterium]